MRKDLINAKAYKIGYKFTTEMYHRFEIFETLEEAIEAFEKYKKIFRDVIILPIK